MSSCRFFSRDHGQEQFFMRNMIQVLRQEQGAGIASSTADKLQSIFFVSYLIHKGLFRALAPTTTPGTQRGTSRRQTRMPREDNTPSRLANRSEGEQEQNEPVIETHTHVHARPERRDLGPEGSWPRAVDMFYPNTFPLLPLAPAAKIKAFGSSFSAQKVPARVRNPACSGASRHERDE